ncbi:hypothetical protein DITRI_Ditri06bG0124300 [Diplodiscus trichospermus]
MVEFLVKRGAEFEARTNKGIPALQIADSLHYAGISRILFHGSATNDGMPQVAAMQVPVSFEKAKMGKEIETKAEPMKRRPSKARTLRGSFDRSLPLAVI